MKVVLLNNWELTGSYPGFWAFGRSMEVNAELRGVVPWIPAEVPGSVHWDLHRAGYLLDPYFGMNAPACEWVNERDWLYRNSFTSESAWQGKRIALVLEGVDYTAKVLLNGKELGSHSGMFTPGEFDLSDSLRYGESNTLVVVLERSPDGEAQLGYTDRVDHLKSRFGYRWDFSPRLVHIGLWKEVCLKITESCVLENVKLEALPGSDGTGELTVSAVLESGQSGPYRLIAELHDPEGASVGAISHGGEAVPGLQSVRFTMEVPHVRLWWPNGYGEQPLYRLELRLETADAKNGSYILSDSYSAQVGFRELAFQANPGAPADALAYTIDVNGAPIYIKGWNWVPVDQLYGRNREELLKHLIMLAKQANVNMLRVWGGGLIEKELFYRLCNEAGILIWQEMMQSSSGFNNEPSVKPEFLHTLSRTMRHAIREKRNHPSMAIWCGGNELTEGGHLGERMMPLTDRQANLRVLRDLASDLDASRLFLPTSPTGPTFFLDAEKSGQGVMHDVHGPWKYSGVTEHYRLYNGSDALLHSEYGGDGFASMMSLRRFLPEDKLQTEQSGSVEWLLHGYEYWNMDEQLKSLFGPRLNTLEQMVDVSQWLQAEGIRYAVEANRRRAPYCSGSLLWQFNEPYPNLSCTSAIDYYGDPKLAYSWVAQANRNLHVSLQYDAISYLPGEVYRATVYITNDGFEQGQWDVEWRAFTGTGDKLADGLFEHNNLKILTTGIGSIEFHVPDSGAFFVTLQVIDAAEQRVLSDNEYAFAVREQEDAAPLQAFLTMPGTALKWETVEVDGGTRMTVTNSGETVALWVRISGATPHVDAAAAASQPVVRPLKDGFLLAPGQTVVHYFEGIMPEERQWVVKALNS
ncbi:glycoside hydrolase family 2 protein [Paenibacillus sp. PAMC21692]|uniref:glycoside hydrolase family 2 protein n=1 Tax=Paenibacillus sp. PAMC21692 TaxID=2762320 RepID=UPI00164E9A19|nr:glycoside hydrolase family 2 TIM barrel-domain containing protein [Paenibacillus sp. PAMC21692]QNK57235.1 hypothetical protein H7F31_32965 [Paenibacillus sp. PAMC21692]